MRSRTLARCIALAAGILWATGAQACDSDCDCYGASANGYYGGYGGPAYGYLAAPINYAPPTYAYYQPVPIPSYAAPAYGPIYDAPLPLGYGPSYPPNLRSPYWRGYASPPPTANPVLAQDKAAVALTRVARPLGSKAFAPQTTRIIDPARVGLRGKPAFQMQATGAKVPGPVFAAPGPVFAAKVAPQVAAKVGPKLAPTVAPKLAPTVAPMPAFGVAPKPAFKLAPKPAPQFAARTAPYGQATAQPAHVQHAELKVQRSK
jgi:hypothetical protein